MDSKLENFLSMIVQAEHYSIDLKVNMLSLKQPISWPIRVDRKSLQFITFGRRSVSEMTLDHRLVNSALVYDAEIRVFDPFLNQWIVGRITQVFFTLHPRYRIQYAGRSLILEQRAFSFQSEIRDELMKDYILADIRYRTRSLFLNNQYELRILTNDLPDAIYILAVAAYDYNRSRRNNNRLSQG